MREGEKKESDRQRDIKGGEGGGVCHEGGEGGGVCPVEGRVGVCVTRPSSVRKDTRQAREISQR